MQEYTRDNEMSEAVEDYEHFVEDGDVRMGMLTGSETVLFIKTGQGGTVYGDGNRYLRLAKWVRGRYGLSVIASATVNDGKEVFEAEMAWVRRLLPHSEGAIYYLGVSKGGLIGCWYGADEPRIRRVMMVNAPLMINFQNRTVPALKRLTVDMTREDRAVAVYGTDDPSYSLTPFIRRRATVRILEGAGHNLENTPVSLIDMVDRWLLFDAGEI